MEFVFAKINVPHEHSFITRKLVLSENNPKIHSHKNYELNLIISGSGRRIVGNNISGFEAGDLVLLGPDLPHCWEVLDRQNDSPPTCVVIHFDENIVGSDFFNLPELETVKELLNRGNSGLFFKGARVALVKERMERLVNLKGLESYIELLHIFKKLIQIDEKESLSLTPEYPTSYFKDLDQIKDVYEYVRQDWGGRSTIRRHSRCHWWCPSCQLGLCLVYRYYRSRREWRAIKTTEGRRAHTRTYRY